MAVWNKSLFDEMYNTFAWDGGTQHNKGIFFHYNWYGCKKFAQRTLELFLSLPGSSSINDIIIIGSGFGWTAELLRDQYGKNVVVVDTSEHIIGTHNTSEEQELRDALTAQGLDPDNLPVFFPADQPNTPVDPWTYWLRPDGVRTSMTIYEEDLSSNASRRTVSNALGNNMDLIITEYVLEVMDNDAAALSFLENCENLRKTPATSVVHIVAKNNNFADDPRFAASRSAAEWRTFLDTNGFNHLIMDPQFTVYSPGG